MVTDRQPTRLVVLAVALIVAVIVTGAQSAWVARQDSRHAAEQRAEAERQADCVRRVIRTLDERSRFTAPLDDLDEADDENLDTMIATVTNQRLSIPERKSALERYQVELARIRADQKRIRVERAKHKFPKLEDCLKERVR